MLFRADHMGYASVYISKMYMLSAVDWQMSVKLENNVLFAIVWGMLLSFDWRHCYKNACVVMYQKMNHSGKVFMAQKIGGILLSLLLFVISVASIMSNSHNPFIYFRF